MTFAKDFEKICNELRYKKARKKVRQKFVDKAIEDIEKGKIPKELVGNHIRILHFIVPLIILYIYLHAPLYLVIMTGANLFIALSLFIYFEGCILSTLEYKLTKSDHNIVDIFLYGADKPINKANRMSATYAIAFSYGMLLTFIFCKRFIKF
jgi:hypothetical protein